MLPDNGIQFTNRKCDQYAFRHIFACACQEFGIAHRLTKTNHPWTNGQVERMNRTLKDATVKPYDYETHDHLKEHLHALLMAYNFAKRLQTFQGLTPSEHICQCWHKELERLTTNPYHHTLGLCNGSNPPGGGMPSRTSHYTNGEGASSLFSCPLAGQQ